MSLKPQPSRPMPEQLARLGTMLLPSDSPYRLIGDQLYAQYDNADFADLYHQEGKPALPPVDLLFVLAFQALENIGDRAAADAVRLRLDWKYALHLPLDYAGFNFSVLSDFRSRLLSHAAAARLFDHLLVQLRELGLPSAAAASTPTVWPSWLASTCSRGSSWWPRPCVWPSARCCRPTRAGRVPASRQPGRSCTASAASPSA